MLRDGGLPRWGLWDWVARAGWHPYEQQKIYEEDQRSSPNDKVKGMPMGACHLCVLAGFTWFELVPRLFQEGGMFLVQLVQ